MRRIIGWCLAGALACAPLAVLPQTDQGRVSIRVLDLDRLFQASALGQRLLGDIRDAEARLEADNQALFDQLAAEERALTEARATLTPEDFRARADAFDARVESIRAAQAARGQEIVRMVETAQRVFREAVFPVLRARMDESGIDALLPPDAIILGPGDIDITARAIEWLDAAYPAANP